MSRLKLPYVFLGSPPIGNHALKALQLAGYPPVHIIDNPRLTTDEIVAEIDAWEPTFLLVVGYGAILRQKVLDTVAGQVLNIHPSYLPEYRGPAPVVQTILDGAWETGVTLMEIDAKMDHGPILAQEKQALSGKETPEELYAILTNKGVKLFLENIDDYLEEKVDPLPQVHDMATITHFVKKEDGKLWLDESPEQLERMVRAYQGWPRTWVELEGKQLLIDSAILRDDTFIPVLVQPTGGKQMDFAAFCNGRRQKPEEVTELIRAENSRF
jgi:methionyl-tRNA formyltransferase